MFWNWYANVLKTMAAVITKTVSHNEIMSFQINKIIIMNWKKYMEITKTHLHESEGRMMYQTGVPNKLATQCMFEVSVTR